MLIKLKEANLYPETHIITLRFLGLFGYEHVMDYIGRYIEDNRERDYNLIQASSTGPDIYATLYFYTSEAMKKFWNEHISVYGERVVMAYSSEEVKFPSTATYFEIPESEGIRGGKIPVRHLKTDDLEERLQEYKKLVNKYFGVANAKIVGIQSPRRNGKSIFADYQYGPLKDISGVAIATIEDAETEKNRMFMNLNNLPNFVGKFEVKLPNQAPLYIRNVYINEKKGVVTIVWRNGDVTMAKCGENDVFDPEKGIAIAFMKHWFNSTTQMNKWLKEQTAEYYERLDTENDCLPLKDLVQNFIKNA